MRVDRGLGGGVGGLVMLRGAGAEEHEARVAQTVECARELLMARALRWRVGLHRVVACGAHRPLCAAGRVCLGFCRQRLVGAARTQAREQGDQYQHDHRGQ